MQCEIVNRVLVVLMVATLAATDKVAASTKHNDQVHSNAMETCEVARMKCAYRAGCGMALQNYIIGCSDVMSGSTKKCSDHCRNSLIALTSTEEGQALMKCKCTDAFCLDAKKRIDICRSAVLRATHNETRVSCSVAQWICMADPLCSTALDYYHSLCRSMFAGKKCTHRCNNSISILRRQEKAAKLSSCWCDGSEDYDCQSILDNMERLCFHKPVWKSGPTTRDPVDPPRMVPSDDDDHNHHVYGINRLDPTTTIQEAGHPQPHDGEDHMQTNRIPLEPVRSNACTLQSLVTVVLIAAFMQISHWLVG